MTQANDKPHPTRPHERRDINVKAIYQFVLVLSAVAIVVHVLIWGVYEFFVSMEAKKDPRLSPLATQTKQVVPSPRLQATPILDYRGIRQNEEQMLSTYSWVDKKKGIVRIPIDQAMKQVLQKNMFHTQPATQPPAAQTQTTPSRETDQNQ